MPTRLIIFLLILSNSGILRAQSSLSRFGLQLGNNVSLPSDNPSDVLNEELLLRYSVGLVGRILLKENLKFKILAPVKKGEISLDYGLNLVFKGYNYNLRSINAFTDEITLELPIQIAFQDQRRL